MPFKCSFYIGLWCCHKAYHEQPIFTVSLRLCCICRVSTPPEHPCLLVAAAVCRCDFIHLSRQNIKPVYETERFIVPGFSRIA